MTVPASNYALRFREASSAKGADGNISDSRFFVDNYGPGCYDVLIGGLEHPDPRVRAETVLLFSRLGIRKPAERISAMAERDKDVVVGACIAYLKGIEDADGRIPELLYTVNHRTGPDFRTAMRTLGSIATEKDIPEIRRVYAQVDGDMHEQTREALSRIIDRDPDLEPKRMFVLSEPIYPDEDSYTRFLAKSIEYLDVRYRKNIEPRTEVKLTTYNNVVSAILTMQVRLYNETANLDCYSERVAEDTGILNGLIVWAAEDLRSKRIIRPSDP